MRVFIALNLDETLKQDLVDLQDQIQRKVNIRRSDYKWVKPEGMHLTLKFLGDIADTQSVSICEITEQVVKNHGSFELDIQGVGCFGGRSARVLWVGCGDSEPLMALQDELATRLDEAGWPKEAKRFTAHLTICRIRSPKAGFELAKAARNYENVSLGSLPVDGITVYQSQLRPEGPLYTALGQYKLI